MSEQNQEQRKLELKPEDLDVESLTVDELDGVAGGMPPAVSDICHDTYTCTESYTCPRTYTCP